MVCPLPAVLILSLVERLVVCRVEVVDACLETRLHDGEILVGECYVDADIWAEALEELHKLLYVVRIHLCGLDLDVLYLCCDSVTLRLSAARQHNVSKGLSILSHLVSYYGAYATSSDDDHSCHRGCIVKSVRDS